MKIISVIITLLIFGLSHSQDCMTYQEMESHGFKMAELDSIYPNAIHSDSVKGPFTHRQEEFHSAWLSFYKSLMKYLNNHGLEWESPTWCHMKIYFKPNGEIHHWFYNFKTSDNIPESTQDEFENLIKQYMQSHKVEIKSDSKFSQCSGVTFINLVD